MDLRARPVRGTPWRLAAIPIIALTMAAMMLMIVRPAAIAGHVECDVDLIASQDEVVGEVCVSDDGVTLTVEYKLDADALADGWGIVQTHLAVSLDEPGTGEWMDEGWQNSKGNPAPGQFPYSTAHDPAVDTVTHEIAIDEIEGSGSALHIAAHAVIEKETVLAEASAPYFSSEVEDSNQGQRNDGSDVLTERSDPENALEQTADTEDTFFSLGFGGYIEVEFGCPVQNGEGADLSIYEVTGGVYPAETAKVEVSDDDGASWEELGEADNSSLVSGRIYRSDFELPAGMESATHVRITDTTDSNLHNDLADGFDVDGVEALHDCRIVEVESETAWGDGSRFVDRGNWATRFTYELTH